MYILECYKNRLIILADVYNIILCIITWWLEKIHKIENSIYIYPVKYELGFRKQPLYSIQFHLT